MKNVLLVRIPTVSGRNSVQANGLEESTSGREANLLRGSSVVCRRRIVFREGHLRFSIKLVSSRCR